MSFEENQRLAREFEESNPHFREAKDLAAKTVERAQLNEAIRVINELIEQVDSMPIAERFSRTRKIKENINRGIKLLDQYEEMTEVDYKRSQLKRNLTTIREEIAKSISELDSIVMDMEAAKLD